MALKVLRTFVDGVDIAKLQQVILFPRLTHATGLTKIGQAFCREAMIWRQFKHPNILPFYGVCNDEFAPQLAMVSPWMDGGDLPTYLNRHEQADRLRIVSVSFCLTKADIEMIPFEA